MTFPNINYKFNDLEEARALTDIFEQKCATIEKYFHDGESLTCDVEFQKVAPQQSGQIYKVELNLAVGGNLYRAEAVEESFEKAIDVVRSELDTELQHAKGKKETLDRQAGREMKEKMLTGE